MGELVELPSADLAIRALHAEIERLASRAAASYILRAPLGVQNNGIGDEMLMFYDDDQIKVFTCNGSVFISGIEHFGYWPDWFCLPNEQARLVAQALLSAAGHVSVAETEPEDPE
ncbi:hypothetical protein A5677_17010 [Mycobacterium malmoense]|uniref:Uncharacterized protein n=1 Tax=Mycobacterium malmoense TaxID=1780 RepID=A0A1B9DA78_MYCMA|nr:hypothetical protein [Mycobacterium malmoense]OCB57663.1 hypothetical protein A5677_17010 [Mycobacterium malmoense]